MVRTGALVCAIVGVVVHPTVGMQETATQALTRSVREVLPAAAADEQAPCTSCAGAPCVNPPCQVPNLPYEVVDQTGVAAALSHQTLQDHAASLEVLTAGERVARQTAEQHARDLHAAQVAAEDARRAQDVANAQYGAAASASVAQLAEYRNQLNEVASQAAEQASAEEAAHFVEQVAANEAHDVMEAVRAQETANAHDAISSASEAVREYFRDSTSAYVTNAVHAGAMQIAADEASSRSAESDGAARLTSLQADIDASSAEGVLSMHQALEAQAVESETHAAELQARAAALAASADESRSAVERMEQDVVDLREAADVASAQAADHLRQETEMTLQSIQRTAVAGQETLESVADEVGQTRGILSVRSHRTVDDLLLDDADTEAVALPEHALPVEVHSDPMCIPCLELPPCVAYVECP